MTHEILHNLIRKEGVEYAEEEEYIIEEVIGMPAVRCPECAHAIRLNAYTYWNAEGLDIRCDRCKALLSITLKDGELKRIEIKEKAKEEKPSPLKTTM